MKQLLLTLLLTFTFSLNAQYAVMYAVDLNEGAEEDYLKLEAFWSEIHKEAIKQGSQNGWSVWKRTPKETDEASAPEYIIFDGFESEEKMNAGYNGTELAFQAYKGKMSRRSIQRMLDQTGSESKERRTYQLKGVAATILAGGDIKKGDKMSVNFMNKKTDDFENYETQVWKPVAEKNILAGNLRQWILVEAIGRSENAYSGWTHLVFNVQAENPGDPVMMSGFKWDKLWEGIESSRDMSEADELVCVYSMN